MNAAMVQVETSYFSGQYGVWKRQRRKKKHYSLKAHVGIPKSYSLPSSHDHELSFLYTEKFFFAEFSLYGIQDHFILEVRFKPYTFLTRRSGELCCKEL